MVDSYYNKTASNLSDVASASTALANLGGISNAYPGLAAMGYVAATGDRYFAPRYAAAPSACPSGSITLTRITLQNAVTCTGNLDFMWQPGTGSAGANCYVGIFDSTGARIAASSDLTASFASWQTLATGKTTWAAGNYYCAYVCGTQWGTTYGGPEPLGGALASNANAPPSDFSPYRTSRQTGSLTAMPSSLTLGSGWTAWFMNMCFQLR